MTNGCTKGASFLQFTGVGGRGGCGPLPEERRVAEPVEKREMVLYHATTPKKVQHYHASGRIVAPVRGFTTLQGAMAWACKTGRSVVLEIQGEDCHKLPDHHNRFGDAWWVDHDIPTWKCVFSPKDA